MGLSETKSCAWMTKQMIQPNVDKVRREWNSRLIVVWNDTMTWAKDKDAITKESRLQN